MFEAIWAKLTGRDEVERAADWGLRELAFALQGRRLTVPREPLHFIDPADLSPEELLGVLEREARSLDEEPFVPWIMEVDGRRHLPVFTSMARMTTFYGELAKQMGKVFPLGSAEILLADLTAGCDVDVLDLNSLNRKSWEVEVAALRDSISGLALGPSPNGVAPSSTAKRRSPAFRTAVISLGFLVVCLGRMRERGDALLTLKGAYFCGVVVAAGASIWLIQRSRRTCWSWLATFFATMVTAVATVWLLLALKQLVIAST